MIIAYRLNVMRSLFNVKTSGNVANLQQTMTEILCRPNRAVRLRPQHDCGIVFLQDSEPRPLAGLSSGPNHEVSEMIRLLFAILISSVALSGRGVAEEQLSEVRYAGNLVQPDGAESRLIRSFEVILLTGSDDFFCVLDDERDGCPWPESFGRFEPGGTRSPHLVVDYDQLPYTIALPFLRLDVSQGQQEDEWRVGDWTLTAETSNQTDDSIATLEVVARERRGRRQHLTFDSASGLLKSAKMDVFMGQGIQFELQLQQESHSDVAKDAVGPTETAVDALLKLQSNLSRRADSQQHELSARQVEVCAETIPALSAASKNTPLAEAVFRIRRNVSRQQQRLKQTMSSRNRVVASDAPAFTLRTIDGKELNSATLKGKTTVLHFWKYSDQPLKEPYGQVGYLEFLHSKRSGDGLRVIGVSTNTSLLDPDQTRQALRSTRKLSEFMNLSYPIGFDDGSLIRSLGDPRESGGDLPLWIVIGPNGKVTHYHAGFYEVDRRAGLRDLTEAIDAVK